MSGSFGHPVWAASWSLIAKAQVEGAASSPVWEKFLQALA